MDAYSSGEELVIKTRKPYTITKQRERWTEEEHNRFLEALKLHGRAWQRIEEHIGTKTAVQIRSHAQKFFSKLEKKALAKGVPTGQSLDIEIPPPRPKRKPSNPYPRKTSAATLVQMGMKHGKSETPPSFLRCKQVLDLEKEPLPERPNEDEKSSNLQENQDGSCSEVFTHIHEANCSSVSLVTFREFVPSLKETINNDTSQTSDLENSCTSYEKQAQGQRKDDTEGAVRTDEMKVAQNYPQHVAVHVLDGSRGTFAQNRSLDMPFQDSIFHPMGDFHGQANLFANPAASTTASHQNNAPRSTHQAFPTFHTPFTHLQPNQEDYQSFLHVSSTFSNLIVSTLLQNPAAHATASFAATFWPYANVRHSADSPTCDQGGFPSRQMNSATSMAGIAAATVAAATTWWAAHGMLSLCAPLHTGCTCAPAFAGTVPPVESDQAPSAKTGGKNNADQDLSMQNQQLDHGYSEVMQGQHSASKSPTSSSDCEESGDAKVNIDVKDAGVTEPQDANKTNKKQVDRSSSDSNSPCSEMEIDVLEKHEKDKEDPEEADVNHPQAECNSRRGRSSMNLSDSWKEVSEGGRLAFQALFSREVLPQSFSPPHDGKNKEQKKENIGEDKQNADENNGETSTLHLTSQASRSCSDHREVENNALSKAKNIVEKSQPTIELGHEKLKGRQTGFKPYKRCSVEAKESRMMNTGSQGEGKDPKRIRLEGEASTYLSYSAFN
ncbi:protein LATE ELONGATED HYPOCOTYL-like isoform X2 [Hibiscus syriacus]|uniref:protein LATE ELONGATED HYPOCOTYL-like isoform X2 n=1 Tax=Hibiscus syriacus TaxID=106335 RepID=UPI001923FB56|nr:protein LATE ELONGATED HYPOCOTYL-like isoform X2 [Hibiscus syriacus]